MKQRVIGIVLATIAVYVWGFLYWGISPIPYTAWKQTNGDEAAQKALLEHFPESGTYYLPGRYHDEETMNRLFEAGPVGFVHINLEGRPAVDPSIMISGFFFTLVAVRPPRRRSVDLGIDGQVGASVFFVCGSGQVRRTNGSDRGGDDRVRAGGVVASFVAMENLPSLLQFRCLDDGRVGVGEVSRFARRGLKPWGG